VQSSGEKRKSSVMEAWKPPDASGVPFDEMLDMLDLATPAIAAKNAAALCCTRFVANTKTFNAFKNVANTGVLHQDDCPSKPLHTVRPIRHPLDEMHRSITL